MHLEILIPALKQGIYEDSIGRGLLEQHTAAIFSLLPDNVSLIISGRLLTCWNNAFDCLNPCMPSGTRSNFLLSLIIEPAWSIVAALVV